MRRPTIKEVAAFVLGATVIASTPALAAEVPGPGFEIGARFGYGFSAGRLGAPPNGTDNDLGDFVTGQWPIWLDAGYRLTSDFYLGGLFQYGFGTVNQDQQQGCRNANVNCSASDIRLGIMGRYAFPALWQVRPWAGLGVGYEWGSFSVDQSAIGNTTTEATWSGFEFANLQVGGDFHLAHRVALGPFFSLSLGQYGSTSTTTSNGTTSTTMDRDLAKTSLHEWIMFGVRGAFMP